MSSTTRRRPNEQIPLDDLLEDLKRVADELGRAPTVREYHDHGRYNAKTVTRHFESWRDAVRAVGCEPSPPPSWSKYRLEALDPEDVGLSPLDER